MNKYFLSIVGILLSVLSIFSCSKKENVEINYPQGTFSSINTLKIYETELYTNKGKTTDGTVIANFINKNNLIDIFLDRKIKTIYRHIPFTIEIDEEGNFSATSFYNPYASGKVERLRGNEFLLPNKDSTIWYSPANGCPIDFILRFPPSIKCTSLPSVTGYSQICRTRILIPIIVKNNTSLAIPIYSIFYSLNSANKEDCYVQEQSNFIKENFYKSLSDGDTVLVQRKEHLLEKI